MAEKVMRVGFDGRLLMRNLRGIGVYLRNVLIEILDADRDNQYFIYVDRSCPYNASGEVIESNFSVLNRYKNLHIVNVEAPNQFLWEQFFLPMRVRKDNLSVLHMPANRAPFFCPCKLVVTVHDMIEIIFFDRLFRTLKGLRGRFYDFRIGLYIKFLYFMVFKRADLIITDSEYSKKDINKFTGISLEKIKVIYSACTKEFRKMDVGKENYILALGGEAAHKNSEAVLLAFARLPDGIKEKYTLRVIGQTNRLKELVEQLGEKNISIEKSDFSCPLVEIYNKASVFVFLSLYEGFGFPPLEAMSCGTPVVASDRTSIPEVTGGAAMLVDPLDIDAISDCLAKVLSDDNLRKTLIDKGYKRVKKFSRQNCAHNHYETYRNISLK